MNKVFDRSHIHGMDSIRNNKSAEKQACTLMQNCYPGDPPTPRNGFQDLLVDTTKIGYGGVATLFKPPALIVTNPDGEKAMFIFNYNDDDAYINALECWEIDTAKRYKVMDGDFTDVNDTRRPYFGLLPMFGNVYVFTRKIMTTNHDTDTAGLLHKVVEWDADTATWIARDLFIGESPTIPTSVVSGTASGLTSGYWVSYASTYVRRTDDDAFALGNRDNPAIINTYAAGVSESVEDIDERVALELDTSTDVTYGDGTTEFNIEEITSSTYKYVYTGFGTVPDFTTLSVGSWVHIENTDFASVNNGIFKVIANNSTDFTIENSNGIEGIKEVIGSGSIKTKNCKVTLGLPAVGVLATAEKYGATHIRYWRTDHATTEAIAEGLTHKFLVDVPIFGSEYSATYEDTTSRNTLDGETNYLVMTDYTEPPKGRFCTYSGNRLFLGGDPDNRGKWWYTEIPGGDGGTSFANEYPEKYMGMFKQLDYYINTNKDDGQTDTGIAVLRDDVYFFKEKKISMLRNADVTQELDEVSDHIGCVFPNTIVVCDMPALGEMIFFMSNEGPAAIFPGGTMRILTEFTIGELYPGGELLTKTSGDLMNDWVREKVHAICHNNTIFVEYGDNTDTSEENVLRDAKTFGYHSDIVTGYKGCLQVTLEDFEIE